MKKTKNTKGKIVDAAWKLFYEQGFENTTVEEIIIESKTSKGSFYHYFQSKEDLLGSLADLFDEKYTALAETLDWSESRFEILLYLNRELFEMVENRIDMNLLKRMYAAQLTAKGEKQLLDYNRVYYKLLRKIMIEGQERGEITKDKTVSELVRFYAFCERAVLYDWCLYNGEYSLKAYAQNSMPALLTGIKG
ncbi:MAG: TetR/AcrR family transcriptional regulator [Clostridia bacterium]|nr:TetR/AcrR family transcriptional regulator [Clostridia bacterium]